MMRLPPALPAKWSDNSSITTGGTISTYACPIRRAPIKGKWRRSRSGSGPTVCCRLVNSSASALSKRSYRSIMVNLGGRDVEGYVNQVKQRIAREVKIPPGYRVEFGGEFKNLEAARARLMLIVPVALALIFVLIFFVLNSVRQSFLVFTGIPFAISGGVFALYLRGLPFSIPAAIGFIALSGVAVLNGLVLVSYFNQIRLDGASLEDTVFQGGLTRLRPVLTTALVAALGFVPDGVFYQR